MERLGLAPQIKKLLEERDRQNILAQQNEARAAEQTSVGTELRNRAKEVMTVYPHSIDKRHEWDSGCMRDYNIWNSFPLFERSENATYSYWLQHADGMHHNYRAILGALVETVGADPLPENTFKLYDLTGPICLNADGAAIDGVGRIPVLRILEALQQEAERMLRTDIGATVMLAQDLLDRRAMVSPKGQVKRTPRVKMPLEGRSVHMTQVNNGPIQLVIDDGKDAVMSLRLSPQGISGQAFVRGRVTENNRALLGRVAEGFDTIANYYGEIGLELHGVAQFIL